MFSQLRSRLRNRRLRAAGVSVAHGGGGVYTQEIAPRGAGHYIYDPSSDCPIHGRRLEACCDIEGEPTAREELHGHAENLSRSGIEAAPIRASTDPMINGRRERREAHAHAELERDMAGREGDVESAPRRAEAQRATAVRAQQKSQDDSERADGKRRQADELRHRHQRLDRRYRISPSKALIAAKAVAVILYDTAAVVVAFALIPGSVLAKVLLAIGLAFAPLAASIGLASWLSAANHQIRFGRAAGRYALVAALIGGLGLLLMIPFRAAAFGDEVIAPLAFSFLTVVQIALLMAETASWMVWFDAKVGRALVEQISTLEAEADHLQGQASAEGDRAEAALGAAEEIEREAARNRALLRREEPLRREITKVENGSAEFLTGVRDDGILEGIGADNRDAERRAREGDEAPPPRVPAGM